MVWGTSFVEDKERKNLQCNMHCSLCMLHCTEYLDSSCKGLTTGDDFLNVFLKLNIFCLCRIRVT